MGLQFLLARTLAISAVPELPIKIIRLEQTVFNRIFWAEKCTKTISPQFKFLETQNIKFWILRTGKKEMKVKSNVHI
jgi:hypothetical protein